MTIAGKKEKKLQTRFAGLKKLNREKRYHARMHMPWEKTKIIPILYHLPPTPPFKNEIVCPSNT